MGASFELAISEARENAKKRPVQDILRTYALLDSKTAQQAVDTVWNGETFVLTGSDEQALVQLRFKLELFGCTCAIRRVDNLLDRSI